MKVPAVLVLTALLCALGLAGPPAASAQGGATTVGCSLKLPDNVESVLDSLLLGACPGAA